MTKKYKPATKPAVFEEKVILLPYVVAETVLGERGMDPYSPEGQWFVGYVDGYVRWLHANKPDWKKKLEKSRDPRPFVYAFVNHWFDAYVKDPVRFKRQVHAGDRPGPVPSGWDAGLGASLGIGRETVQDCVLIYHWKPVGKTWKQVRESKVTSLTGQPIRSIKREACRYWTYTHEVPGKGVLYVTGGTFRGETTPRELLKPPTAGRGIHGLGAGEETVDSIYLGNFGDVSPLDYHGFFVWWIPSLSVRRKGKQYLKRLAKNHSFKSGDLFAIKVTNWCDASGECENEERVLAEEIHVDVDDLLGGSGWIDWDAVASSVGMEPSELRKDPVWALDAAIGYYGAHEFHPGGYNPLYGAGGEFVESFDRMARDLLNLGVPKSEVGGYLRK